MLTAPQESLVLALRRFIDLLRPRGHESSVELLFKSVRIVLPSFKIGDRKFVFASLALPDVTLKVVADAIRKSGVDLTSGDEVLEICIGIAGAFRSDTPHAAAGLGVRVESLHGAIARLVSLPEGWCPLQLHGLRQTLQPVLIEDESKAVDLLITLPDGSEQGMTQWISSFLSWDRRDSGKIAYLRAEAGKGKSTTLANFAYARLSKSQGPLPLFVRLRGLERGTGVSWAGIAERLGVVDADASRLAIAVRAGLVILMLDGLDEVSGRHNPAIVQQVVKLIDDELLTSHALLAISGRTTEGAFFQSKSAIEVGLELPEVTDSAFEEYASMVISRIVPEWQDVAQRLPEPVYHQGIKLQTSAISTTDTERNHIKSWLCAVFDGLGKDRSLFFVQSLACIGRSRQLDGNQPLIIGSKVTNVPSIYDVCDLAASLACVREQDKIDPIAREIFAPASQLDLITIFALMSSAEAEQRALLPSPNELAKRVFGVDTTHQNEEFSAIIHQMQKHALLYSRRGEGATAGDWRPTFLSEWIRCMLLVRAWKRRMTLGAFLGAGGTERIRELVARAEQAQLAYRVLWPSLDNHRDECLAIGADLTRHASDGSPEATSNFWALLAAISPEHRTSFVFPPELPPLSDFSGVEFDDMSFGQEFSGSYVVLNNVQFLNCDFRACQFIECEFTAAEFRNCRFTDVQFAQCQGGALFDGCEFLDTSFLETRSMQDPAWNFVDCRFFSGCRIEQSDVVSPNAYLKACKFRQSTTQEVCSTLMSGNGLGFDRLHVDGLLLESEAIAKSLPEYCLRNVLKTFFPSGVGEGQRQARRYIRSTALGRGTMPSDAPTYSQMVQLLEAEGFTDGGRDAHIYAPWSSVAGGGENAIALRNELSQFMEQGKQGPSVKRMLGKIRRWTGWT